MSNKKHHEENRLSWNAATEAHNSHKHDQAKFFLQGGSTLFPDEIELLGNISDQMLVHLQCNSGQDSLSLAGLGAHVTGVDISDTAIQFARELSRESGLAATFVRADVYDWLVEAKKSDNRFDVVFSSYGALVWLSDIREWADGISNILKPNGRLVVLDFHPLSMIFGDDWSLKYPYFGNGAAITWEDGIGDYVAMSGDLLTPSGYQEGVKDFQNPYRCHEYQWSIGEIVTAVLDSGLTLTSFKEYPYMNGAVIFDDMRKEANARNYPPAKLPALPLMFGLVAHKLRQIN